MALTQFSSVISIFTEKAFNDIVSNLRRQRPAIFNYGTGSYRKDFESLGFLCDDIRKSIHPVFKNMASKANTKAKREELADMLVGKMDPLSIPGYTDDEHPFGIEWCMQVVRLDIDIHPESVHAGILPPELNPPLKPQTLSLRIRACAGINCPGRDILDKFTPPFDFEKDNLSQTIIGLLPGKNNNKSKDDKREKEKNEKEERPDDKDKPVEISGFPFDPKTQICKCIDLFALVKIERNDVDQFIGLKLINLEIVDIPEPKGLEDIIECFLKTTITLGVFPQIRFGIDKLLMELTKFLLGTLGLGGLLDIKLTPISQDVPFNPSLDKDSLKVMLTVTIH